MKASQNIELLQLDHKVFVFVLNIQGVSKKSSTPTTFCNICTSVESFSHEILQICWQFISTYICQFLYIYLIKWH